MTTTAQPDELPAGPRTGAGRQIAYIMSRFPKLSETFVLYEMLAMAEQGFDVELYPLLRERTDLVHPEAIPLVARANFQPLVSVAIIGSHLHFLLRRPRAYVRALWALLRGTAGSTRFLLGALVFFPKIAHIARLMANRGVDHVHCHFASHPAAAGFVIHRLTGIPFSFTAHGTDLHVDRHMLREKVAEAAFVIAISEDNRRVILDECGDQWQAKVAVIHCGVDTSLFRKPASTTSTKFTILCVGRLLEVKGQIHLIEACRILAAGGLDFVCHLVGEGPDRDVLAARIREVGLGHRVRLAGSLARPQLLELLGTTDVLVAPSVPTRQGSREGIPVSLMEAMSMEVPVVASRISGIPELVDDGTSGLLVSPGDAEALAGAIGRLYEDPELRHRLGRAGRSKVVVEFDLSANAARLGELVAG
ncbi:MAG: glycosyltransferase [Chloroflexi bacterium]|nr:glycosyltransferase [Chloroflexota bacterium]